MLQSTTEELFQVFVKDRRENMETIKGHILSKLNYFYEALLSKGADHSSSKTVKLSSFTGTQPTATTIIHSKDAGQSTSSTENRHLQTRLSLESAKRGHPVCMKRSHSNFDSVGQPLPKVACTQTLITSYAAPRSVDSETVQSTTLTTEDKNNMISDDSEVSKPAESQDYKLPTTFTLSTPGSSTSTSVSSKPKLLSKPVVALDRLNVNVRDNSSSKPKQQALQNKPIRRTRCSDREKHLCPICSQPDCGKCKHCLYVSQLYKLGCKIITVSESSPSIIVVASYSGRLF